MNAKRRRAQSVFLTLIFGMLMAYFVYHALSGDRGLLALVKLSQQVEHAQQELENAKAERMQLEHRVKLLKTESIDLDLLDEQSRKVLGYSGADETVYFSGQKNKEK